MRETEIKRERKGGREIGASEEGKICQIHNVLVWYTSVSYIF